LCGAAAACWLAGSLSLSLSPSTPPPYTSWKTIIKVYDQIFNGNLEFSNGNSLGFLVSEKKKII